MGGVPGGGGGVGGVGVGPEEIAGIAPGRVDPDPRRDGQGRPMRVEAARGRGAGRQGHAYERIRRRRRPKGPTGRTERSSRARARSPRL